MPETLDPRLLEDIKQVLSHGPMTVSDLIGTLRRSLRCSWREVASGRRWRIGGLPFQFERELHVAGMELRERRHGSGIAVYVGLEPFDKVRFYHGTDEWLPVQEWRCSAAFCSRCDG